MLKILFGQGLIVFQQFHHLLFLSSVQIGSEYHDTFFDCMTEHIMKHNKEVDVTKMKCKYGKITLIQDMLLDLEHMSKEALKNKKKNTAVVKLEKMVSF